jgi:hypothetical protein
MKIVRFDDGSYVIRRGWISREYLELDSTIGKWWSSPYEWCHGTREKVIARYIEFTTKKDRCDSLDKRISIIEAGLADQKDAMMVADRDVRPYRFYPFMYGDREVRTSTVLYAMLDKLGFQAVCVDGKIVIEDKPCDTVSIRAVPGIKADSVKKRKKE